MLGSVATNNHFGTQMSNEVRSALKGLTLPALSLLQCCNDLPNTNFKG